MGRKKSKKNTKQPLKTAVVSATAPANPESLPGGRLPVYVAFLIVAIFAALPYLNIFQNQFTNYDEEDHILKNEFIRDSSWSNIVRMMGSYNPNGSPVVDYPLTHVTYAINYRIHGYDPWGYHAGNLLLHVIVCLFVLAIFRAGPWGKAAALWGTLLFAAHPVHVESVTWIISRKDVLSGALALAGAYLYIQFIRTRRPAVQALFWMFSIILWIGSVYSKPNTIALPGVLAAWALIIESKENRTRGVTWLAPWFLVALLLTWALSIESAHRSFITTYIGGSLAMEIFQKGYALIQYLWTLIYPFNLSAYHQLREPSGWGDPLYAGCWAALAAIVAAYAVYARRRALAWFHPAWFIIWLLPVLGFIPFQIKMADRYLYLSSAVFCLGVGLIAGRLCAAITKKKPGAAAVPASALLIVIIAAWSVATFNRNAVWRDSLSIWTDCVKKCPDCAFPINNLAVVKKTLGDISGAEELFLKATKIDSNNYASYANLATIYSNRGDNAKAVEYMERARKIRPKDIKILKNLAKMYIKSGNPLKADLLLEQLIDGAPPEAETMGLSCQTKSQLKNADETLAACKRFYAAAPSNVDAIWLYAAATFSKGNISEAEALFKKYSELNPTFAPAWINRGLCLFKLGKTAEARAMWEQAQRIDPANEKAREFLSKTQPQTAIPGPQ